MSKKKLLISLIAVIIIIVIGVVLIIISTNKTLAPTASTTPVTTEPTGTTPATAATPTQTTTPGTYVAYNAATVAADKNTKVLFFHAPWCPQCRALDSDITKNIANDSSVTIYKVDYDTNQELRKKYGVTLQTTIVKVDDSGNLVKKYVAYQDPTYANVKANIF